MSEKLLLNFQDSKAIILFRSFHKNGDMIHSQFVIQQDI